MSFTTLVDRVRIDFVEMPELQLTLPQAVRRRMLGPMRLFGLEPRRGRS